MTASDGGKGSDRRPMAISDKEYADRWDAIFGRDQAQERTTHHFVGDGWGGFKCCVCGKNEKYAHHGERCIGKPAEVK